MKKLLAVLAATLIATLAFAVPAGAQDAVRGTMVADPPTVPEAGEYEFTITGTEFIPETDILLTSCTAPGDALVPGVSTDEEIVSTGEGIAADILGNCDIPNAINVTTDAEGGFTATLTATVGDNTFINAGTLDASQTGGTWVPVVDAEAAAALAVTGVDSADIALIGVMFLLVGALAVVASRRLAVA